MFKWFKRKNINDNVSGKEQIKKDEPIDFIFSFTAINKQAKFQTKQAWIEYWEKKNGDFITKGEDLCKIEITGKNKGGEDAFLSIVTNAENDGYLEILKDSGSETENHITDREKLLIIHPKLSNSKAEELRIKRFTNIPDISIDDFKGTKEIKWISVAGQKKKYSYDSDIYDSFIFFSNDNNYDKLIFTLNNIDNKDFIIFKYPSKDYKLIVGSKISLLFDNGNIIELEITIKPHKNSTHINWGTIFETKVQLTIQELEILKTSNLSNWKIDFAKTDKKITGIVNSSDTQFSINKLTKEYCELVKNEIDKYEPLNERNEISSKEIKSTENCYVYLMIDSTNGYHKIGISNKPKYREKTLQSEKPTIEMLCSKSFPNRKIASSFEQALHQTYAEKRIRGEWFDLTEKESEDLKDVLSN